MSNQDTEQNEQLIKQLLRENFLQEKWTFQL